jgi:hypothetical protein
MNGIIVLVDEYREDSPFYPWVKPDAEGRFLVATPQRVTRYLTGPLGHYEPDPSFGEGGCVEFKEKP